MSSGLHTGNDVRDSYLELVLKFRLTHIRSEGQLNEAVAVVDSLLDMDSLDTGQQEYLDVLSDLIHTYESREHPIESASDGEILRHLMDANELTQKEFAANVGIPESVVSEILSGKRQLNRKQIESICGRFAAVHSMWSSTKSLRVC